MANNIDTFLRSEWKPENTEQVASKLLKNIFDEKSIRENECVKLKQVNSKPLRIAYKPKKPNVEPISHLDMRTLQTSLSLSANETHTAAKILRGGSRKRVASNLRQIMDTASHVLDDYFESVTFEFTCESKEKVTKHVQEAVVCKDIPGFIDYVVETRNLKNYHLKFGIDGGGKFLKVCLSI